MSILDVGCGPGYVSVAAAERGAIPIGLDFSEEMIAIAKKKFPRIEFRQGDAQNLPFPDASFDRIVANFAPAPRKSSAGLRRSGSRSQEWRQVRFHDLGEDFRKPICETGR